MIFRAAAQSALEQAWIAKQIATDRETVESTADFMKTEADKAARYAAAINDKLEAAGLPRRASLLVI